MRKINIILCGNKDTGKSLFLSKILTHESKTKPTVGVDIQAVPMQHKLNNVNLVFWDLSGDPMYRNIIVQYFKIAEIVIIFYDTRKPTTFHMMQNWVDTLYQYCDRGKLKNIHLYMLNTSTQIPTIISQDEIDEISLKNGMVNFIWKLGEERKIIDHIVDNYLARHPELITENTPLITDCDTYLKYSDDNDNEEEGKFWKLWKIIIKNVRKCLCNVEV